MIVKNEATLVQALDLIKLGAVRYSDHTRFSVIEDTNQLEAICRQQLANGDIGIVVLRGRETFMEDYDYELKLVLKERKIAEQKAVRAWVAAHPTEARIMMEKAAKREEASQLAELS